MNIDEFVSLLLAPVPRPAPERPPSRHVVLFFLGNGSPHGHRRALQDVVESILEKVSGFLARSPDTGNFARRGCPVDFGSGLFACTPELNEIMQHATLLVAIENPLSGFATRDGAALAGKVVVRLGQTVPERPADGPGEHLDGDALEILTEVDRELERRLAQSGEAPLVFPAHPRAVLRVLNEELPRRAGLFMDICAAGLAFAGQEIRLGPEQFFEQDVENSGCMAQAFGESIGARYRAPKEVGIACMIGDSTFIMAPTGSLFRLSVSGRGGGYVLTVLENGGYDFVRQGVENGGVLVGHDDRSLPPAVLDAAAGKLRVEPAALGVHQPSEKPHFVAAGALWRCDAYLCSSLAEYRKRVRNAFLSEKPVILEVPIHRVFRAPISDRSGPIAKLFGGEVNGAARAGAP